MGTVFAPPKPSGALTTCYASCLGSSHRVTPPTTLSRPQDQIRKYTRPLFKLPRVTELSLALPGLSSSLIFPYPAKS